MNISLRGTFTTGAGMLALWTAEHFQGITDYDTWETQLLADEDIRRHIMAGTFVPLYIHSDGAFGCEARVGDAATPTALTPREQQYLTVSSQPYLFRSQGQACLSGIEEVGAEPPEWVGRLSLPAGDYAVTVHLLAWDEEPEARGADGRPFSDALPDLLLLLNPAPNAGAYRTQIDTFDPPSA